MELKLKRNQVYAMHGALTSLDRVDNPNSDKKDKISFSTNTTYALYKNLKRVTEKFEEYEKIRNSIVRKYLKDGETSLDKEAGEKATKEWNEFAEAEDSIELFKIKFSDLQVEKNKIPLSVLVNLGDIIIDDNDLESQLYADERKSTGEVGDQED